MDLPVFDTPGFYQVLISGRSQHHLLDRFVLHKSSVTNPTSLSFKETNVDHRDASHGKLSIKIIDKQTEKGIANASVKLDAASKLCDQAGSVFFYEVPKDSSNTILVNKSRYQDYTKDIQISGDTSLTLQLERLTTSATLLSLKETRLRVVPNPSKDFCRIMISTDHTSIFHASVFDLHGRKLKSAQWFKSDKEDNFELDLSDMNAGIYFLHVTSRNKIVGIRKISIGTL